MPGARAARVRCQGCRSGAAREHNVLSGGLPSVRACDARPLLQPHVVLQDSTKSSSLHVLGKPYEPPVGDLVLWIYEHGRALSRDDFVTGSRPSESVVGPEI